MHAPETALDSMEQECDLTEALTFAIKIAQEAGNLVLSIRAGGDLAIQSKSNDAADIVTRADRASERLIAEALQKRYPDHSIRGEEGTAAQHKTQYQWTIDPVDGTQNFSEHKPFSVSIGLERNGESVLGVLYFPDDRTTLSAIKGRGTRMNDVQIERHDVMSLREARLLYDVSSRGNHTEEIHMYADPFSEKSASMNRPNCCTWAARQILEGKADGYLCGGGLTPFDLAAMIIVMREAGCVVEGLQSPLDLSRSKNPVIMAVDHALADHMRFVVKGMPNKNKRIFFESLAVKYLDEMRLLFRGGNLWKKDKWRNVAEHCVMQLAAAKELCKALELPEEQAKAMCSTSAIHDWKKRWEVTKQSIPADAHDLQNIVGVHDELFIATDPDHLEKVFMGKEPFTEIQQLQLWLDLITRESDIVRSEDRITEVSASPRSAGLTKKADGRYWEKVREQRDIVEIKLFAQLTANGHKIACPADIPLYLKARIEANWNNINATA